MLFSELVEIILRKRNIGARDLGEEIGVTGATISNILSGRIIKPQGETCKKLLGFCQEYGIDTSKLDWNEVIQSYFNNSKYVREYDWISDVMENGTFKLRHKKCGRITTVPIMGLDGASMPCIFCWAESYISRDAYTVELNSNTTEYRVKHRHCGHEYTVSYEQIKQKKFRCPRCFRNSEGKGQDADYGKRQDYRFISDPGKIITPEKVDQEDFVFEDEETPLENLTFEDFLSTFKAHPRGSYSQELKDFGFSEAQMEKLVKAGIRSVEQVAENSFEKLNDVLQSEDEAAQVVFLLAEHKLYLDDYRKENCNSVENYLHMHMTCIYCGHTLKWTQKPLPERMCLSCQLRFERLKNVTQSAIALNVFPPEKMNYTGGGSGYTVFTTLTSNYYRPAKFELADIHILWNGNNASPDYNYRNHEFPNGYFFPECPRTFGKIWLTDNRDDKELKNGDQLLLTIKDKQDNSEITFVYSYENDTVSGADKWSLFDYQIKSAEDSSDK